MDPKLYSAVTLGTWTNWSANIIRDLDSTSFQVTCGQGNTILHLAAKAGNKQATEHILNTHPSLAHETNMKGDTPLHIVSRLGHLEVANLLMNHYDDISTHAGLEASTSNPLHVVSMERNTVIHEAARNGCFDVVKSLIEKDQSLASFTNEAGESPLFLAVDRGYYDCAIRILETFPNCTIFGRNGMTAMHAAIIRNENYLVHKLLEKGGLEILEMADNFGWMPIHYAAHLGNMHAVQTFLRTASSLAYIKDNQGMTALHISAKNGHNWVIKKLIQERPDVCELVSDQGQTALHVAVENAKINAGKTLLDMMPLEGLINEPDIEGNTSLHVAAIHENYKIIEILAKDSRVDKGVVNKRQMTAFDILMSKPTTKFSTFEKVKINSLFKGYEFSQEIIHNPNARYHASNTDDEEEDDADLILGLQNWRVENVGKGKPSSSKDDETAANLNIVIATFIAGITFAAAIQVPGGYDNDGIANLKHKASFKYFLFCNSMAFGFAAGSLLIHFACEVLPKVLPFLGRKFGNPRSVGFSFVMWFTICSVSSTVGAFMYATEATMYDNVSRFGFVTAEKDALSVYKGLPAVVANLSYSLPCLYLIYHLFRHNWLSFRGVLFRRSIKR